MDKKTLGRIVGLVLVTGLFAASIITMIVGLARFEPLWFWPSLGAWIALVALVLFIFRVRDEGGREAGPAAPLSRPASSGAASALSQASLPDMPIVVTKATGRLPVEEAPRVVEREAPGFTFRGFTLYETTAAGRPRRFFSRTPPPEGQPITLPMGFEAAWDPKKREPVLRELAQEQPEVTVITGAGKPCAASDAPGEFCEKDALDGSRYCKTHANYRPGKEWAGVEARLARPEAGRGRSALRTVAPDIEVVTAKPTAQPLKLRIPTIDVRVPKPTARPLRVRPQTVELRIPKPTAQPLRVKEPTLDVRQDHVTGKPLRLKGPTAFELRDQKPKAKPFRVAEPKLDIRRDQSKVVPLRPAAPNLDVRLSKPQGKPLRVPKGSREPDGLDVRLSRPKAKPLRLKAGAEPHVKWGGTGAAPAKPLRVAEPDLDIRTPHTKSKPLRVPEPKLDVRVSRNTAKPLRNLPATTLDVKQDRSKVKPLRPTGPDLGDVRFVTPEGPKFKPLKGGLATTRTDLVTPKGDLAAPPDQTQRCSAKLLTGKGCPKQARQGSAYCASHQDYRPASAEVVVMRDTKSRSGLGVPSMALRGSERTR